MKKLNALLFIGNGFDIAYNYATRYVNFTNSKFFKELEGGYLYNHIVEALASNDNKWVDLETELYNYSIKLTKNNECTTETFKEEFFALSKALQGYLSTDLRPKGTSNLGEIEQMNYIAALWREYNNIKKAICFNYSNNPHFKFYGQHREDHNINEKVHGSITTSNEIITDNKIVLGIDDSMIVNPSHSFLYKSHNENLQIEGVSDLIMSAEKYIIFGCSLGCTDEWYFRKVFSQKGKTFEVYYYGKKEKYEILNRIHVLSGGMHDFRSNNNLKWYDSSNLSRLCEKLESDYKMQ